MKRSFVGIAFVAAATLFGMSAHANCAFSGDGSGKQISLPAFQSHFAEHEGIVGTWLVNYGKQVGQAFIQWHSDGTEWENITHPTIGGNICMGSWIATGPWTVSRNHFGWLFDSSGMIAGFFHETETDTLSRDGNSYAGNNLTNFYAMDGTTIAAPGSPAGLPIPALGYPGTANATRIAP